MAEPKVAGTRPSIVEVTEGETYYWCACGHSASQPFCDGAHAGTGLAPLAWTANRTGKAGLCTCKRTKNPPLCDGSHQDVIPG